MSFAAFPNGTKYRRIVTQSFFPQNTLDLSFELIMQHPIILDYFPPFLVYCVVSLVREGSKRLIKNHKINVPTRSRFPPPLEMKFIEKFLVSNIR